MKPKRVKCPHCGYEFLSVHRLCPECGGELGPKDEI